MPVPALRFNGFDDEWVEKRLEDITKWESGGTPSKEAAEYWNGDIPWISASTMRGLVYADSDLKITELGLKKGSKLAKKGSLLLLVRGSMLFNKIPIGIAGKDVAFNQDVKSIVVDESSDTQFLLNWFASNEPILLNMVTGTGIGAGKIDLQELKKLPISFPTLPEQQKLASFFSSIDARLGLLKRKRALLAEYKLGVMQGLFGGGLRFKGFDGAWEERRVKDIYEVTRGNVLSMTFVHGRQSDDNPYPVYSSQTKQNGLSGFYDKFLYENAITWTTDGAGAGDVNYRHGKFYCTNVCGVLLSKDGYSNLFIAEYLNTVSRKYVSYVGNPKLMNNVMSEIPIPFPTLPEQEKIATFLSSLDKELGVLDGQIGGLVAWKKGMLGRMFC
jgi:type I restriction enzyme, S subunit